ncbi:MAG: molybdopterin-dependent oxidoreductase, partial [Halioglobus sp.]|nr:molybdopterin-dependent oxidoreductase [Halioglobus sp.]
QRILAARKVRGTRLVVIDPRRTETAELATEHHFIRPGTDALFLLALLNTLFCEKLANPAHLTPFITGLDTVQVAVRDFTPEYAAVHTGIAADAIRGVARELAAAGAAVCYGRMGVSTQAYGALNQWLIQIINIATGNLDKPGGSMFTLPAIDQIQNVGAGGFARHHSAVRGLPEFDRELPTAALAEEIENTGEYGIRALFTGAGNPVLSAPNGRRLDAALAGLEFMVALDPYLNETTRHAHVILPPTSPLEHDHYDLAFHMNAVRNTARYNPPVFAAPEGALHDWEIFTELGARVAALLGLDAQPAAAPDQIVDMGLQLGPYAGQGLCLQVLKDNPSGIDLGPLAPQLPARLKTPGQVIRCDTPDTLADLARLRREFPHESTPSAIDGLQLIGRRHVRSNNSWMHNFRRLVKGPDRCTLLMHPQDMRKRGVEHGSIVAISSRVGKLEVTVEASETLMPGVVSLPHGYGHQRAGIRMAIACEHAGVSCNDITDELALDELSGNAAVNGVPVEVRPL